VLGDADVVVPGLRRLQAFLSNPVTWKGMGYLLMKLPIGIVSFIALVTSLSVSLSLLLVPVLWPWTDVTFDFDVNFGVWHPSTIAHLLRNMTYVGMMYDGKKQRVAGKSNPDKKTRWRKVPHAEWVAIAGVEYGGGNLVFRLAQRKRIVLPGPEFWSGSGKVSILKLIDSKLAERGVQMKATFRAILQAGDRL